MAKLFESITFREVILKNRLCVSPMCQYSSVDGFASEWHLVHLGSRAIGGAGLVFTEATSVNPEGRISPEDLGIWKDDHITNLQKIANFITNNGSVPGIQLAHAGRKASHQSPWNGNRALTKEEGGWDTLAPSPIPFRDGEPVPLEMNSKDIKQLINDFKQAAKRSLTAGFKVIEIHAAHGYLINEFLSPLSNFRKDEYGGSFENRCRLLLEIIDIVRTEWPVSLPIFVRISATDWVEGGWDINDSVQLGQLLKMKNIDLVDCSSGGNSPLQNIITGPLYQVPFSEKLKRNCKIATGAVGLITTAEEAEKILIDDKADLIFMARQLLREPYFPIHAAKELKHQVEWNNQYKRAIS